MGKIKICLDAGHYGKYNRSPVVPEYYESEAMWKLHLLLKAELEKLGFAVITTRTAQEKDKELTARGKTSKGFDLFLSLHSNACDTESVDRPVAIVQLDGKGVALGMALADCVAQVMGTANAAKVTTRKGSRGEYYGVLRGAAAVGTMGIILEHSFHTNTRAAKWLLDEGNLARLAQAEAQILAEYYGMIKETTTTEEVKTVDITLNILKKGAKGAQVKAMQQLLMANGCSVGSSGADGSFGPATDKAVRAYQKAKGLQVDGSVGPATWNKLLGVS